jgi:hypothetical protein
LNGFFLSFGLMGYSGFFFCPRGNLRDEGCPTFETRIPTFVNYFTSGADEIFRGFFMICLQSFFSLGKDFCYQG